MLEKEKIVGIKISQDKLDIILKYLFVILMCFQAISIMVINLRVEDFIDYDASLAVRHCIEMWKHKTLFLNDFNYFSTLETDSVAFFAIPLYFLTGNLGISMGICHVVMYVFFGVVLVDYFAMIGKSRSCGNLAQILIFTPYTFSMLDWTNMISFAAGQYEFRILSMLLILDAYENIGNEKRKWKRNLILILSLLVNFWTALSCGNYVLLMVCFPFVVFLLVRGIKEDGFHVQLGQLFVVATNIAVNLAGWYMHNAHVGQSFNNNKMLVSAFYFTNNILNAITGAFLLTGGVKYSDSISIISKTGIVVVCKFIFTIALLVFLIHRLTKRKGNKELSGITLSVFLVNTAALCLMQTKDGGAIFECRYHILWLVMLMVALAEICTMYMEMPYGKCIMIVLCLFLILFNVDGTNDILKADESTKTAKEIIKTSEELDNSNIYLLEKITESHQIRALDTDIYCMAIYKSDEGFIADTGDFYASYSNPQMIKENLLIAEESAYNELPEEYREVYTYVKTLEDGLSVYKAEYSPWVFVN